MQAIIKPSTLYSIRMPSRDYIPIYDKNGVLKGRLDSDRIKYDWYAPLTDNSSVLLKGNMNDSDSSISAITDTKHPYTGLSRIHSFKNNNVEKSYIKCTGLGYFYVGVDSYEGRYLYRGTQVAQFQNLQIMLGVGCYTTGSYSFASGFYSNAPGNWTFGYGYYCWYVTVANSDYAICMSPWYGAVRSESCHYSNMFGFMVGASAKSEKSVFLGYNQGWTERYNNRLHVGITHNLPFIYGEMDNKILRVDGNTNIINTDTLAGENIQDNSFDDPSKWAVTGGVTVSGGKATLVGAGTLKQVAANLLIALKPNTWYYMQYNKSGQSSYPRLYVSETTADKKYYLTCYPLDNAVSGNVVFRTKAGVTDFEIESIVGGTVSLESITVKEVIGGKLNVCGNTIDFRNIKSGANQGASGANAGELWCDTSAGNVIKLGV